jgi:hypothetical protein
MVWNKSVPVTGTAITSAPNIFEGNWTALEDITGEEHYTFTNALSGRHKPGEWPVFFSSTTSGITAVTSPGSGALAWDTTLGLGKIYDGTSWGQVNMLVHSRVSAYRNGDKTLTTTDEIVVPFDTETFDSLSEFSTTTYTFTTTAAGYYLIKAQLSIIPSKGGIDYDMSVKHTDAASATILQTHAYRYSMSTDEMVMEKVTLLPLSVGDRISIIIQPGTASAGVIAGGADRTFLKIYRAS